MGALGAEHILGRKRVPVERAVFNVVPKLGSVEDVLVVVAAALKGVKADDTMRTRGFDRN